MARFHHEWRCLTTIMSTFYQTVTAAVSDLIEHGYDSVDRVAFWMDQLRDAARSAAVRGER